MATQHEGHTHVHGSNCGHTAIKHDGHTDYLHDGHLHHMGKAGVEEHQLAVSASNPAKCTPDHKCGKHDKGHKHGPGCGHEAVPHGDHVDYLEMVTTFAANIKTHGIQSRFRRFFPRDSF